MISRRISLLFLVGTLVLGVNASALERTKKAKAPAAPKEAPVITLQVPQSQVDYGAIEQPPRPSKYVIEASGSSWAPTGIDTDSYLGDASDFHGSSSVPQVSLNATMTGWDLGERLILSPKVGFSFTQLTRNGTQTIAGNDSNRTQTLSLYSARVGAELTPKSDIANRFQPYVGAAVLPTWEQFSKSALSESSSRSAFALEASAGVVWHMPRVARWLDANHFGLELGLEATRGIAGSQLSGAGVLAGTRVEL